MIRGKFLAQDDFDLAGHRLFNWKWLNDIPHDDAAAGQTIAYVDGEVVWATLTSDGIVSVAWNDITGKPTEYPPETHGHGWDEISGKPTFVNTLTAGSGLEVSSTTGNVIASLSVNVRGMLRFFIGAAIGSPVVDVTSDGADITLALTSADDVITLIFHSVRLEFDTSGSPSITLTAGTDDVPVANYIWIPSDTQVLTVGAAWPTGIDYVPIATVFCQSAASAQTDGLYKVHAWTDHTFSEGQNGHLGHINAWIREQNATWRSGTSISPTLGAAQFDIAISEGVVLQLHNHTFPVLTTVASVDPIFVLNDSVTPYKRVANMVSQLLDSVGGTLSNRYYSIVIWGVVSEDEEDCQLLVNLPKGSYSAAATAQADSSNYSEYGIPEDFRGCGFLIARLVVKHAPAGNTYTLIESIDLRGSFPTGFGGGSSGSGDHGGLIGLSDMDHPTSALQQTSATTNQVIAWSGTTWLPDTLTATFVGAASIVHAHTAADVTDFDTEVANNSAVVLNTTHRGVVTGNPHVVTSTEVGAAQTVHTHSYTDVTDWSGATISMSFLTLSDQLTVNGNIIVNGGYAMANTFYSRGDIYTRYAGSDGDSFHYFKYTTNQGAWLKWDFASTRFEFNNDLHVTGSLIVTSTFLCEGDAVIDGSTLFTNVVTFDGGVSGISHTDVGAAATTHTHPVSDLEPGVASASDAIVLTAGNWGTLPVVIIQSGGISNVLTPGTAVGSSIIMMESLAGSIRSTALSLLPISNDTQTALDAKEDTLAAYDTVPTNASTNICESNGIFDALATKEDTLPAYDTTPTNGSTNICDSDGIYDALATKSDTTHTHVYSITAITSAYTASDKTVIVGDATAGFIFITLPAVSGNAGLEYIIKRVNSGGNAVYVDGNGNETVDGAFGQNLGSQYSSIHIICDGTSWLLVNKYL